MTLLNLVGFLSLVLVNLIQAQSPAVRFRDTNIRVEEGGQATVGIERIGAISEDVIIVVKFEDSSAVSEFEGTSRVLRFMPDGSSSATSEVLFITVDDDIPEADESYSLILESVSSDVSVDSPSSAQITILANDDAYGIIQFADVTPLTVSEDRISKQVIIPVTRERGTFGDVTVTYEVRGEPTNSNQDITPSQGVLVFNEQVTSVNLILNINPDDLPEADETFTVNLISVGGGARKNASKSSLSLTITENDSPVQFSQSVYSVQEAAQTFDVIIYRGLSEGVQMGPVSDSVTVVYLIGADTADLGTDFFASNGSLTFMPGQREKRLSIVIFEDDIPELDERITLTLTSIIGDAVLGNPSESFIVILANDDQHGVLSLEVEGQAIPSSVVDEDNQSTFTDFKVIRTGGAFGRVTVDFEVISLSGEQVTNDLIPSSGTVRLEDGETSAIISIFIVDDFLPEAAEAFVIRLINDSVTGGAVVSGSVEGQLTIRDSDDAYGVVQFSSDSDQSISRGGQSRRLQLLLTRSGGTIGNLQVSVNATYMVNSQDTGGAILTDTFPVTTVITSGSSLHVLELALDTDAFLQIGASFVVTLVDVTLSGAAPIIEPSSPILGDRTSIFLEVTPDFANGEIGFSQSGQALEVDEPEGSEVTELLLNVTREGTSGPVVVYWRVQDQDGRDMNTDIAFLEGTIEMATGVEMGMISLIILPDSIAETKESFVVELYNVTPSNQRLRQGDSTVTVTILESDDPGGFFEFSPSTLGPFYLSESSTFAQVTILRVGGSLVERSIYCSARGDDGSQLLGIPNVVVFPPGVVSMDINIVANSDGIPELNMTYDLLLTPYGNPASKVGVERTVTVVVLESDDPYGVFNFPIDGQTLLINESLSNKNFTAEFEVVRGGGSFGDVTVSWMVMQTSFMVDVYPTEGTVNFPDGFTRSSFMIQSVNDQIPEQRETFSVVLFNATGGSRLGDLTTATLVINSNDDALFIQEPAFCATEPSVFTLYVVRSGNANTPSSVKYRTLQGTALEALDYIQTEGTVAFDADVTNNTITVQILADTIPEAGEAFQIELYEAIGDVVLIGNPRTTVEICPNDVPGGFLSFQSSPTRSTGEGETLEITVQREGGTFGSIRVYWLLFYSGVTVTGPVREGDEFEQVAGSTLFQEGQTTATIVLRPLQDNIPEFEETYLLSILNITVDDPRLNAQLAVARIKLVSVTIGANDDPYGVLDFVNSEQEVAEDYNLGDEGVTSINVTIQRQQGLEGNISVIWEILSDSVATGWPTVLDLLFVSDVETNLNVVPAFSQRRQRTGTMPYSFNGASGSIATLPPEVDFDISGTDRGFSISGWVKPTSACNGFIASKVDASSPIRMFYGLKLDITTTETAYVEFRYSNTQGATNFAPGFTLGSTSVDLDDGEWHLLAVAVDNERITFFVDGESRHESVIQGPIADGTGFIYVGGSGQNRELFQGLLQDVRFYDRKLLLREVSEIWNSPSLADFTSISGIVTFDPGQAQNSLQITTSEDEDPEGNELYQVLLVTSAGGARVASDARTLVNVLKSDNANGLFAFDGTCSPAGQGRENVTFSCLIQRSRGDTGVVTIPWEIRNQAGEVAFNDFENATGKVIFQENVREKTIRLMALNDALPELSEQFNVILLDNLLLSDDGLIGSTNTSGASINPEGRVNTIVIAQSDNPNGLFQFSLGDPPGPSAPVVTPAGNPIDLTVPEDVGVARLLVVRAQGLLGAVSLEWRTIDGTAVSAGKNPIDFMSGGGTVDFADRQRFAYIDITVLDNDIPELAKNFQVELSNPTGGAALGPGSIIDVTIDSSDDAYGIFEFSESSLLTSVNEGDAFQLQIIRSGGALGEVTLYWMIMTDAPGFETDPFSDVFNPSGNVTFAISQMSTFIEIITVDDEVPELDETFSVVINSSDAGTLGAAVTSVFTILANDDPYGVFVFSSGSSTVRTPERNESVTLQVFREKGSKGTVQVTYATLSAVESLPSMPAFISRAEEDVDFIPVRGSLIFNPGQINASIQVPILNDDLPESEESVFVVINSVMFLGSEGLVDGSPRQGEPSIAEIEILANDNANGVLQLSTDSVVVSEDYVGPVINVTRTAGAFGTVTVKFQTIPGSALANVDYSVTSTDVILYGGETSKQLPIEIINDRIPERNETFQVRLLDQITGGAILGTPQEAEIMIESSDDPNGNFGFGTSSQTVTEPSEGQERQLTINLVRNSGVLGVVAVQWEARLNGVLATEDVFPTGGTLHFLSGDVTDTFNIRILPDDVPEERENIVVSLVSASGGAVIGDQSTIIITIEANNDPHGVVEFARANNNVVENEGFNSQTNIPVIRRGGLFGELEVTFNTQPTNLIQEALKMVTSVLEFYQDPVAGSLSGVVKTMFDVSTSASPLTACAERCLEERACGAFEFQQINVTFFCLWSVTDGSEGVSEQNGVSLYRKNIEETKLLYETQALSGIDYTPVISGTLRIPAGQNASAAMVNILDDLLPERDEVFMMNLLSVRVVDSNPLPINRPTIGPQGTTGITIESNDDANGIWSVYSNSPNAVSASTVLVQEREGLSVSEELVIERRGGTIGDVSVSWRVSQSTATPAVDYTASGGTVNFGPGETRQVINIGIKDDDVPEDDEMLVIEIYNPTGGSVLSNQNNVTVVILANDNVAGVLGFVQLSHIVSEGQAFNVTVDRTLPAKGTVYVDWELSGSNGYLPGLSFLETNGSLLFQEGDLFGSILLTVLSDETPESNEEFVLTLDNIYTEGVSPSGAAALEPRSSVASVTIRASDEPHGVFSFAQGSLFLDVEEGNRTVQLFVERKFGSIGTVLVGYSIHEINLPVELIDTPAFDGQDFIAQAGTVEFEDGQNTAAITVSILEDDLPELDEVFQVNLTSVELLIPSVTSFPPKLGTVDIVSKVTITANDGTQGIVGFNVTTDRISVSESSQNFTVTVRRDRGTYGVVTAFLYSQPIDARKGTDYTFTDQILRFADGEFIKDVTVEILEDDLPEDGESFELILNNPTGGLELGEPMRVTITIQPNDNAFGIISFSGSTELTISEPDDTPGAGSRAQFTLIREEGTFGQVEVPFSVQGGNDDLTPSSGFVTFEPNEASTFLQISAVADSIPELSEAYTVVLGEPIGGAILGTITNVTVIVEESDAPFGLLQIYPLDSRNDSVEVEEDVDLVYYVIERSGGQIGTVTVDVATLPSSAVSPAGSIPHLGVLQTMNVSAPSDYHTFTYSGDLYLVTVSDEVKGPLMASPGSDGSLPSERLERGSMLYRWQGVFVPVQTIETDGGVSCTSVMIGGSVYIAIANQGMPGRRVSSTRIYRLRDDGTLLVVQDISTVGASAVAFLTRGTDVYLMVAQQVDAIEGSVTDSWLFLWSGSVFVSSGVTPTIGAVEITSFVIDGNQYVAIASYYNTATARYNIRSMIYRWQNGVLNEYQQLDTMGAADVESVMIGTNYFLVVANSRSDEGTDVVNSEIYHWNPARERFETHQYVPTSDCQSVTSFTTASGITYLVFANSMDDSIVMVWNSFTAKFELSFVYKSASLIEAVEVTDSGGMRRSMLLAGILDLDQSETRLLQLSSLSEGADFVPWSITLSFSPDDTRHVLALTILPDDIPEDDEVLMVALSNPTNGAIIGPQDQVSTIIASNDDAHGIIVFAQDSLQMSVEEETSDTPVVLTVERQRGTAGLVVVAWEARGDHDMADLRPSSGQIEFPDGVRTSAIVLTVMGDPIPELDETTFIELTEVVNPGTSRAGRGAVIGSDDNTATLTVSANDSPHGVFGWSIDSLYAITDEPEGSQSSRVVTLFITREQGKTGRVNVYFSTFQSSNLPEIEQAISDRDFVARSNNLVSFGDGSDSASVEITVLPDTAAEGPETFFVNLTSAELISSDPQGGADPSVKSGQNVAEITIRQNDNANGILQFTATKNEDGEVEVYEGSGTDGILRLPVTRSAGAIGIIGFGWMATTITATSSDFSPLTGNITMAAGQREATVDISIVDDEIEEDTERFTVHINNPTGGAVLGEELTLLVKILKNDSPRGLFGFSYLQETVAEGGEASFSVERTQGSQGSVNIRWELEAPGRGDISPTEGVLQFQEGTLRRRINVIALGDEILEGEERFVISISSDEDVEISPVRNKATVVIQPDEGSSGLVSILPASRSVLVGEPTPTHDGTVMIQITRGIGIFGEVEVSWQIIPADSSTFQDTSGSVIFMEDQGEATIIVQTIDDSIPELKRDFSLILASITGGALIDSTNGANQASITVVASDSPFGIFEFQQPLQVIIDEDVQEVHMVVVRQAGIFGRVQVNYTTIAGTATSDEDYLKKTNVVIFEEGNDIMTIRVTILPDSIPEGPESFQVVLTSVTLLSPLDVSYTDQNGLQLDMEPVLGPDTDKEIIIDKNDNAEGIIEFTDSLLEVPEDVGTISIPVVRSGGVFGRVSALYTVRNMTASPDGIDYILTDGEVIFLDGQSRASIQATVIDDQIKEFSETFTVSLNGTHGGAILGSNLTEVIAISKSDGPDGLIGFAASDLGRIIPNPSSARDLTFTVELTGGTDEYLTGAKVRWRILGPNSDAVLTETDDVMTLDGRLQGSVTFDPQTRTSMTFDLQIRPYFGPEVEEVFRVEIYQVVGAGEVVNSRKTAFLTILKHGDPNGILQFDEESQQTRTFSEPSDDRSPTIISFGLQRNQGTIGDVQVYWEVQDDKKRLVQTDISPNNGTVDFPAGVSSSRILLSILPDLDPELEETFQLVLISSQGGAEINPLNNVSRFSIRPNDDPHGIFQVHDEDQSLRLDSERTRYIQIQVRRESGTMGSVQINFELTFNDGVTGAVVSPRGSMTCGDGVSICSKDVNLINNDIFLERDTSFTVTLTDVQYIGSDVTIPPIIDPEQSSATFQVPQSAANSKVGFLLSEIVMSEDNYQVVVMVDRVGAYGAVDVNWQAGYPTGGLPIGFNEGTVTPNSGLVSFDHGVSHRAVTVLLKPVSIQDLFAMHITSLQSSDDGGAREDQERSLIEIAPSGIISFDENSRNILVDETEGEVQLVIQRQLGAQGVVTVVYQTTASTAVPGQDYVEISGGVVRLRDGQQTATVTIGLLAENSPELEKVFFVNLTSVDSGDGNQGGGPLLSTLHSVAMVTIDANNDPFGVFSIAPVLVETTESGGACKLIELTITRTGGFFGQVLLRVRTVGGGEQWESDVIRQYANMTGTIGAALLAAQRNASAGLDYRVLEESIIFRENENSDTVQLEVCDDNEPEPAESVYVYLTVVAGGGRVAGPGDTPQRGFTEVIILGNDNFNGIIGFSDSSLYVSVSEDVDPTVILNMDRGSAFFETVTVDWRASYSTSGDISLDQELTNQLVEVEGSIQCPARVQICKLPITLKQDLEPEFSRTFAVELIGVRRDATLNPARKFANITMQDSDHPYGQFGFSLRTRLQSVNRLTQSVTLSVERSGGRTLDSLVSWETIEPQSSEKMGGVTIQPALKEVDYMSSSGTLNFQATTRRLDIKISLPAKSEMDVIDDSEYPKLFRLRLFAATNGASVNATTGEASIVITLNDLNTLFWDTWLDTELLVANDEADIINTLSETSFYVNDNTLTPNQITLVIATLDNVITEGYNRRFSIGTQTQILGIFCDLMDPTKEETRGVYELAELFTRFSYTLVTDLPCSSGSERSLQCDRALITAARLPRDEINGKRFDGQSANYFTLPSDLLNTQDGRGSSCEDIHFIEYNSQQWFLTNDNPVLSEQVLSVGIRGAENNFTSLDTPVGYRIYTTDRRVTPRGAQCVLFRPSSNDWRPNSCEVTSDQSNYVECACHHLSEFAAQAQTDNLVGYNIFVYISCFVVMTCFFLALLTHQVCAVYSMFAARLLMHMCFAAMCLQVVFLTSAYVSNWVSYEGCTALGVLIHYFLLSQFSWIFIQGLNFWKVFVMNDEHTDRYYIIFFVAGWTLPVAVIVVYVVLMYAAFDWPFVYDVRNVGLDYTQVIYGDVHNNGDICFIPNGYAALASVAGPAILSLVAVVIIFMQAFQVKPQWKRYDDIYMGRYNTTEVKLIFIFWVLICLTWLFAGLHLVFSQLWLLVIFIVLNFTQGIYAFVVYTVLRNQLCRPNQGNYSLNNQLDNTVTLLENNRYNSHSNLVVLPPEKGSMNGTLTKGDIKNMAAYTNPVITTEWEAESVSRHSHHSLNLNQMVKPPSVHGSNLFAPTLFNESQPPVMEEDDNDSQEFDDLIFALKTGGALPINDSAASTAPKNNPGWPDQPRSASSQSRLPDTSADSVDHYELRKVAIADTHL